MPQPHFPETTGCVNYTNASSQSAEMRLNIVSAKAISLIGHASCEKCCELRGSVKRTMKWQDFA